jgi:uncharacterized BrkB/YihY/UPF0761 family membrane protein
VVAAQQSIHAIYGAPKDPRNVVVARLRAVAWLVLVAPLLVVTFAASSFTAGVSDLVFDALGIEGAGTRLLVGLGSIIVAVVVNAVIVYVLLANFGGIRPHRRALLIGAGVGAVVFELLKALLTLLISFTIDRPQYGALAAPIGILFVLFLQSLALYACAALTAGIADKDAPLEPVHRELATA